MQAGSVSLPELHTHLKTSFPSAPSLPTLKRWAAAGVFKPCEIHRLSGRPSRADTDKGAPAKARTRYDLPRAIQIIRKAWDLGDKTPKPAVAPDEDARRLPSGPNDEGLPASAHASILDALARLADQVQAQAVTMDAITKSLAQLSSVRSLLMNKYDAAYTQQAQVIESLRHKLADVSSTEALAREVMSLRMSVGKLADEVRAAAGRAE